MSGFSHALEAAYLAAHVCLSQALYHEDRQHRDMGLAAVAETVINRVVSPQFPDDVCGVVKQRFAFSFILYDDEGGVVYPPVLERERWSRASWLAEGLLQEFRYTGRFYPSAIYGATDPRYFDSTCYPTHYLNISATAKWRKQQRAKGRSFPGDVPDWVGRLVRVGEFGKHTFYAETCG